MHLSVCERERVWVCMSECVREREGGCEHVILCGGRKKCSVSVILSESELERRSVSEPVIHSYTFICFESKVIKVITSCKY